MIIIIIIIRTSAIGSNEKASITRIECERELIDQRLGPRRWLTVDSWIREPEAVDLYCWLLMLRNSHALVFFFFQLSRKRTNHLEKAIENAPPPPLNVSPNSSKKAAVVGRKLFFFFWPTWHAFSVQARTTWPNICQ